MKILLDDVLVHIFSKFLFYVYISSIDRSTFARARFGIEGLMNAATIPAAILGSILWEQGFSLIVMLTPIILEVLLVMPILSTIPETYKMKK